MFQLRRSRDNLSTIGKTLDVRLREHPRSPRAVKREQLTALRLWWFGATSVKRREPDNARECHKVLLAKPPQAARGVGSGRYTFLNGIRR